MNKKSHLLILVFFGLLSYSLLSQAPGYLGKRFSTGYGFYVSPGYIGSNGESVLNTLHEAYVEYVTRKKVSIGFSARFYHAVSGNSREVSVYQQDGGNRYEYNDTPSGVTEIAGRNYMLYFKFFRQNYVAPWGKYFILGASLNTFQSSYDPNSMNVETSVYRYGSYTPYKYSDFGPREQSFTRFDVLVGFGRTRIIANRVTIDYGYNVNLMALALTVFDAPGDNIFGNETLTSSEYIETTSAARVRGVNRFNFFCKVGFLLF